MPCSKAVFWPELLGSSEPELECDFAAVNASLKDRPVDLLDELQIIRHMSFLLPKHIQFNLMRMQLHASTLAASCQKTHFHMPAAPSVLPVWFVCACHLGPASGSPLTNMTLHCNGPETTMMYIFVQADAELAVRRSNSSHSSKMS